MRELQKWLEAEIALFPAEVSLLMVDMNTDGDILNFNAEKAISSASTIKLPILITLFEKIENGEIDINQKIALPSTELLPDSEVFEKENICDAYTVFELAYWMITKSDNTATNLLIELVSMQSVNKTCKNLGASSTILQRKMLDFDALKAGQNNFTSACDQYILYTHIYKLAQQSELWQKAFSTLLAQRGKDTFMRYLTTTIPIAHKLGGLDYVSHDAGLFLHNEKPFYLGIFTWDGPSLDGDDAQRKFIGKLAKKIYNTYICD